MIKSMPSKNEVGSLLNIAHCNSLCITTFTKILENIGVMNDIGL